MASVKKENEKSTFFAKAGAVHGWAVDKVVAGALKGAVLPITAAFTGTLTVGSLKNIIIITIIKKNTCI